MAKHYYTYEELNIGDSEKFAKTITETDVYLFAGISGDNNPAHINEEVSSKGKFGSRIVHGILTSGLISAAIGTQLPGYGSIYLEQDIKFLNIVRIGDTITAKVEVVEKLPKGRIRLKTTCTNQDNVEVIDGTALVLAPRA